MTDGDQRVEAAAWPAPHPSPPPPPPRGSGIPGAPPSRAPYVAGAAAALAALALVVLLVVVLTGDDEPEGRASDGDPTTTTSAPASEPASAQAAAVTCWDASPAATVGECGLPVGEDGLRWVFPALADDKCGTASADGGDGVLTRVLCLHRFSDGTRAQVGYFEWASVEQGAAFYDAQGLTRSASADFVTWAGGSEGQAKTATMYVGAPFSVSVTYPASATPASDELLALAPRPPGELQGVPSG